MVVYKADLHHCMNLQQLINVRSWTLIVSSEQMRSVGSTYWLLYTLTCPSMPPDQWLRYWFTDNQYLENIDLTSFAISHFSHVHIYEWALSAPPPSSLWLGWQKYAPPPLVLQGVVLWSHIIINSFSHRLLFAF